MKSTKFINHKKYLESRYKTSAQIEAKKVNAPALILKEEADGVMLYHVVAKQKSGILECAVLESDCMYVDGHQIQPTDQVVLL